MTTKTFLRLTFGLFVAHAANAFAADSKLDVLVTTDVTNRGFQQIQPTRDNPISYVIYDEGYVEGGDSYANDNPPPAETVAQALKSSLDEQGYRLAGGGVSPSVLLTYAWGTIHPSSLGRRGLAHDLDPNFKARLLLVAAKSTVADIEEDHLSRIAGVPASIYVERFNRRNAIDRAREGRYFLIVSAYDYADAKRGEWTPLWRTRISAYDTAGVMARIVPVLAGNIGPYLSRSYKEVQDASFVYDRKAEIASAAPGTAFPLSADLASDLDAKSIERLIKQERGAYEGYLVANDDAKLWAKKSEPKSVSRTALPPELAERINQYLQEKKDLQNTLAAQVKSLPPGEDTRRAIDTFNTKNANRIAMLSRMRENIRSELAEYAANNAGAAKDKSVDALLKEFSSDVQQIQN